MTLTVVGTETVAVMVFGGGTVVANDVTVTVR